MLLLRSFGGSGSSSWGFLLHLFGPTESLMLAKAFKTVFPILFDLAVRTAGKGWNSPGKSGPGPCLAVFVG